MEKRLPDGRVVVESQEYVVTVRDFGEPGSRQFVLDQGPEHGWGPRYATRTELRDATLFEDSASARDAAREMAGCHPVVHPVTVTVEFDPWRTV